MEEKENKIIGADGKEYIQKKIDFNKTIEKKMLPGKRVLVYNKYRAAIQCSDCVLDPESEGSILQTDLKIPFIRENTIQIVK